MERIETPIGEADKLPESKEEKALVRLDGAALTISGKEARVHFFDDITALMDDYKGVVLTKDEALHLSRQMRKLRTGFQSAMPIHCPGAEVCPIVAVCPLAKMDEDNPDRQTNPKVPIGKLCPVESQLMGMWLQDYCEALDVGPDDILDMTLCKQLAELDVYEFRLTVYLGKSENATGIGKNVVGYDQEEHEPVIMEQISPAMELKLKLKEKRIKIMDSLVATRKEQYKKEAALKTPPSADPSSVLSALKSRLEAGLASRHPRVVDAEIVSSKQIENE